VTAKVLLVDGDPKTVHDIQPVLAQEGYQVDHASPGRDTIRRVLVDEPDLVILGVGEEEGAWRFCRQLLAIVDQPVFLLLAAGSRQDRVRGLDLGADDCMIKPPSLVELIARVRALLRRSTMDFRPRPRSYFMDGDLTVDFARREVRMDGRPLTLTPTEFRLLSYFIRHVGEVLSHEQLLTQVWGPDYAGSRDIVKQHVYHLRQKVESDPHHPRRILSRWSEGYLFQRIASEHSPALGQRANESGRGRSLS
jgi:DNA-binding response OmpR family regulator